MVTFAFGLLRGFGFTSALLAASLPQTDVPLAIVSFNVGVQLGQTAFVAVVLLLARVFKTIKSSLPLTN